MIKKLVRILAIIVIVLTQATPVLGAEIAQVNITAIPMITGGIFNFVITYVSDQRLDITWSTSADVSNTMIRGKYGSYPDDIPDEDTTPSDGYLVYYGNGHSASDTSVDFDENAGTLYYKAWAQRADGTWYINTSSGEQESAIMTLIAIILIASVLTFLSFKYPNYAMAIISAGAWAVIIPYLIGTPPTSLPAGSNALNMVLIVIGGAAAGVLIFGIYRTFNRNKEVSAEVKYYTKGGNGTPQNYQAFIRAKEIEEDSKPSEDEAEYRERIHRAKNKGKRMTRGY